VILYKKPRPLIENGRASFCFPGLHNNLSQ
jgi:hypothetical protein